jgi:dihydroorotase
MNYLIKNASVVNEGEIAQLDVLIENGFISKIERNINTDKNVTEINAEGLHLLPGAIDDQVHFREPGLTHKGELYTEAKAAVAGGVTSYMEMPNTKPSAVTKELLNKSIPEQRNAPWLITPFTWEQLIQT